MIRIQDLLDAEKRVEQAEAEYLASKRPENWSAHESIDKQGRRTLHIDELTFERREQAKARLDTARRDAIALRHAYFQGA
ncbi:hypothetical protein OH799_19495 [Nocardia sp. NBC_00881]|uniref:hypothetical protein n=1 Tax=Nocardia sp. NBC_00881 TaxID=2975995 RepID=UPI00386B3EC4|nr:hypothetical protein OH799_19495 [Nocardia sp. NBC_00881]